MAGLGPTRRGLAQKQLAAVPFAPAPPVPWLHGEGCTTKGGGPWQPKYQVGGGDLVPHAGAPLGFDAPRHALGGG